MLLLLAVCFNLCLHKLGAGNEDDADGMLPRKKNVRIDFNQYLEWRASQSSTGALNRASSELSGTPANQNVERRASVAQQYYDVSNTVEPPAPYPTSFDHIVELISTGQPIPGIKDVPDTVLEGQASQTTAERRSKPWEKHDEAVVGLDNVKAFQNDAHR